MPGIFVERHSPIKVAMLGSLVAVVGSLALTFFSISVIGMEEMTLISVAAVAILCPAVIAPPTIYYLSKTLLKVTAQRRELAEANDQLQAALNQVRELSTMLPICAWCHKVRDDTGYWEKVEAFIERNTGSSITHGVCPDCHSREIKKYREGQSLADRAG